MTIRVISENLKSIVFMKSNAKFAEGAGYGADKNITVFTKPLSAADEQTYINIFGKPNAELPYAESLEHQYFEGRIFETLSGGAGKKYTATVESIVKEYVAPEQPKDAKKKHGKKIKAASEVKQPEPEKKLPAFLRKSSEPDNKAAGSGLAGRFGGGQ
jgi:hypothetical protein